MYYRYRIHPVHHNIYDDSPYAQIQAELTAKLDRLQAEAGDQPNSSPTSRGKYQKCLSYYYLVLSQLSTNLAMDKQL